MARTREIQKNGAFEATKFTATQLQDELWDTLQKLKERKIRPAEANAVTQAAKEICNISKVELQHRVFDRMLQEPHSPRQPALTSDRE